MNSNNKVKTKPFIYDKAMNEARHFWREKFDSISLARHIPVDYPCQADAQPQIVSLQCELNEESYLLIQQLTGSNVFLLYTAQLLALQICCYKYSGKPAVTLLSPCRVTENNNRFNLLPIGNIIAPHRTFKELLVTTKNLLSNVYKNQQYPFSRILSEISPQFGLGSLPMMVSMEGLHHSIVDYDYNFDFAFHFTANDATMNCTIKYDSRLYYESTIDGFFQCFVSILQQGLNCMETPIAELRADYANLLSLSSARDDTELAETSELEKKWKSERIDELIAIQAMKYPTNIAITDDNNEIQYKTLNQQANQLAVFLTHLKLDNNKSVAIWMDVSTEMAVSLLAVMKAGASFVLTKYLTVDSPIEDILAFLNCECIILPHNHLSHIHQMRESVASLHHAIVVDYSLSDNTSAKAVGIEAGTQLDESSNYQIWTQEDWLQYNNQSNSNSDNSKNSNRVCCVLLEEHAGQLSTLKITDKQMLEIIGWVNQFCQINSIDRCLLLSGLIVNEQLYNILGMLVVGASIEIVETEKLTTAPQLAVRLLAKQITVWNLPTPLMQSLLSAILSLAEKNDFKGPRNILLSSEKQSPKLAYMLRQRFSTTKVIGLYSDPGVGMFSSYFLLQYKCLNEQKKQIDYSVLVKPIPGFRCQVLNAANELTPPDVVGNLYLEQQNEQQQIIDSGLRAVRWVDGQIAWLRGKQHCVIKEECRVELTKIEAVLCGHPAIDDAEVLAVPLDDKANYNENTNSTTDPGRTSQTAIAFIISRQADLVADNVRDFLLAQHEVSLIPEQFILLDEYPLTLAGNIDKHVLFERFVKSHKISVELPSAEVQAIQEQLHGIWLDTLQITEVSADESFFTLGGNSLQATLLISRIRDIFSVDISVQNFFRQPSLYGIVQLIADEVNQVEHHPKVPELKAVSRKKYRTKMSET